jgi:hypothetical protein
VTAPSSEYAFPRRVYARRASGVGGNKIQVAAAELHATDVVVTYPPNAAG